MDISDTISDIFIPSPRHNYPDRNLLNFLQGQHKSSAESNKQTDCMAISVNI